MKKSICFILILWCTVFTACTSLQESSKYNFESSRYYNTIIPYSAHKVYIDVSEDSIRVFPVTTSMGVEHIPEEPTGIFTVAAASYERNHTFYNPSLDLDILTVPLKYRFKRDAMP